LGKNCHIEGEVAKEGLGERLPIKVLQMKSNYEILCANTKVLFPCKHLTISHFTANVVKTPISTRFYSLQHPISLKSSKKCKKLEISLLYHHARPLLFKTMINILF
jgi:hypothetical protein